MRKKTVFYCCAFSLLVYCILGRYAGYWKNTNIYQTDRIAHMVMMNELENKDDGGERLGCKLPHLQLYAPDQMHIKEKIEKATISPCRYPDWTYTQNGVFYIKPDVAESLGNISCSIQYINFFTDFKHAFAPLKVITNGTEIEDNYFRVTCTDGKNTHVDNHAGAAKLSFSDIPLLKAGPDNMHILFIYFDSVSRPQWHRVLPKTVKFLKEELGGVELEGHSVVGEGTPSAIFPVLTGRIMDGNNARRMHSFKHMGKDGPYYELPQTAKGTPGSVHTDVFPFIWKDLRKRGYIPLYTEDDPQAGLFTYTRMGFKRKPMEHYMRPFFLATQYGKQYHCIGGRNTVKLTLDYLLDMLTTYQPRPIFAYMHSSYLSHSHLFLLKSADDIIVDFLSSLKMQGILDKSIVFLGSDHGPRYLQVRNTKQGKYEHMSPFYSIIPPPWFKEKYPELYINLKRNAKLMTTPWDIRETMMHILDIKGYHRTTNRGVSLFHQIPLNRTCYSAFIPPVFCACTIWQNLDLGDTLVQQAVATSISYMNNITASLRNKCQVLESKTTLSARVKLFRNHSMSDDYEIKIETTPGNGLYEVTLGYMEAKKSFVILSQKDILRTTKYASMVWCLEPEEIRVVNFCVCKELYTTRAAT